MKNLIKIPVIMIFLSAVILSCTEPKKDHTAYNEYKTYVTDVTDSMDAAIESDWSAIESKYQSHKEKAEAEKNEWNDELHQEYAKLESDWDNFKNEMGTEKMRRKQLEELQNTSRMMLPDGIQADMSNVTSENILLVHTTFVDYVSTNKDILSREAWDQAEILWERLGTRKNEIENELKSSDNLKIAEQKVRFGTIKTTNRPVAKVAENSEAKE